MRQAKLLWIFMLLVGLFLLPNVHAVTTELTLSITGPQIVFPTEDARWVIAISDDHGQPLPITCTATYVVVSVLYPNNAVATVTGITVSAPATTLTGVCAIDYDPVPSAVGIYGLVVAVTDTSLGYSGYAVSSFQVSATFMHYGVVLTDINSNGTIATFQTNVGAWISGNFTALNAKVTDIHGWVADLNSTYGPIQATLATIKPQIQYINNTILTVKTDVGTVETTSSAVGVNMTKVTGNQATLSSTVGNFNATITRIDGDTAWMKTEWGNLQYTDQYSLLQIVHQGSGQANSENWLPEVLAGVSCALSVLTLIAVMLTRRGPPTGRVTIAPEEMQRQIDRAMARQGLVRQPLGGTLTPMRPGGPSALTPEGRQGPPTDQSRITAVMPRPGEGEADRKKLDYLS
jgi:Flp pilus assembly pilin Flp